MKFPRSSRLPAAHAWRRAVPADAPAELRDPIYRVRMSLLFRDFQRKSGPPLCRSAAGCSEGVLSSSPGGLPYAQTAAFTLTRVPPFTWTARRVLLVTSRASEHIRAQIPQP
jgi:hypothetical protein